MIYRKETPTQVFSCEICEIFKNTRVGARDRLRNVFAQQIFTLQLNNMVPRANFKIFLPSSYSEKMRWKRGWQLKSSLHQVYFHCYSFATGMANIPSNIFISNVLLTLRPRKTYI